MKNYLQWREATSDSLVLSCEPIFEAAYYMCIKTYKIRKNSDSLYLFASITIKLALKLWFLNWMNFSFLQYLISNNIPAQYLVLHPPYFFIFPLLHLFSSLQYYFLKFICQQTTQGANQNRQKWEGSRLWT